MVFLEKSPQKPRESVFFFSLLDCPNNNQQKSQQNKSPEQAEF